MPTPSPDPDHVLRGHKTDVQALAFHHGRELLYSGLSALNKLDQYTPEPDYAF